MASKYHIFFIYSSVDRPLGCFLVLAVVNSAAMNSGVHVSFWTMILSGYMLRSRTLDHMMILFLGFFFSLFHLFLLGLFSFKAGD